MDLSEIFRPGWRYKSEGCEGGGDQCGGQIGHWCLNAGMAVSTSGGLVGGLVVMEESSEESENKDGNDGNRLARKVLLDASLWIARPHSVVCR